MTVHASAMRKQVTPPGSTTEQAAGASGPIPATPVPTPGLATVQRFAAPGDPLGGTAAPPDVVEALRRRAGRGAPLEPGLADRFGEQLGVDLSGVRVHTDAESDRISRSVQAEAFTHGSDIYFTQGRYAPGTSAGDRLIAHEVAHVAQQRAGAPSGGLTIGRADDRAETDADATANRMLAGLRRQACVADTRAPAIRRAPTGTVTSLRNQFEQAATVPAPALKPPAEQFADELRDPKVPADETEAEARLVRLKAIIARMSRPAKAKLWGDDAVMEKVRTHLGGIRYMAFMAAIGMKQKGDRAHKSGSEVDVLIQQYLGSEPGWGRYIERAYKAGKKAEGYVAVLDEKNWERIYTSQFPDETYGAKSETDTNAFTGGKHPDRPIILHAMRGNAGTGIHEGMHRYSDLTVRDTWGSEFNECFTEYFTRKITNHPDVNIPRSNYNENYRWLNGWFKTVLPGGEAAKDQALADAYFDGKLDPLRKAYVKWRKDEWGEDKVAANAKWAELLAAVRTAAFNVARDLLEDQP